MPGYLNENHYLEPARVYIRIANDYLGPACVYIRKLISLSYYLSFTIYIFSLLPLGPWITLLFARSFVAVLAGKFIPFAMNRIYTEFEWFIASQRFAWWVNAFPLRIESNIYWIWIVPRRLSYSFHDDLQISRMVKCDNFIHYISKTSVFVSWGLLFIRIYDLYLNLVL